jgi:hypothetical protein
LEARYSKRGAGRHIKQATGAVPARGGTIEARVPGNRHERVPDGAGIRRPQFRGCSRSTGRRRWRWAFVRAGHGARRVRPNAVSLRRGRDARRDHRRVAELARAPWRSRWEHRGVMRTLRYSAAITWRPFPAGSITVSLRGSLPGALVPGWLGRRPGSGWYARPPRAAGRGSSGDHVSGLDRCDMIAGRCVCVTGPDAARCSRRSPRRGG